MKDTCVWAMLAFCALLIFLGIIGLMGLGGFGNVFTSAVVSVLPHFFDPTPMGIGMPILAIAAGAIFAAATIVSTLRDR